MRQLGVLYHSSIHGLKLIRACIPTRPQGERKTCLSFRLAKSSGWVLPSFLDVRLRLPHHHYRSRLRPPGSVSTSSSPRNFPTPAARACRCCWKKARRWSTAAQSKAIAEAERWRDHHDPRRSRASAAARHGRRHSARHHLRGRRPRRHQQARGHDGARRSGRHRRRPQSRHAGQRAAAPLRTAFRSWWRDASRHRASSRQGNQRADPRRAQRRRPSQPGQAIFRRAK